MRLDGLEALAAIGAAGSLTGAAGRLGVSTSTVWRRIAALEAALGLTLVERRPDGADLTRQGLQVAALSEPISDQAATIRRLAAALRTRQTEPIRLSATEPMVADILAPALPQLWAADPALALQLKVSTEVVSLARRDADLAIRLAPPAGDSLVAKKLPPIRLALHTSRAWLAGRDPASVALADLRFVAFDDSYGAIPETTWLTEAGLAGAIAMTSPSTRAQLEAVAAGAGAALLPTFMTMDRPDFVELACGPVISRPLWIVMHRDLRASRPIRTVHRWAETAIRAALTATSRPTAGTAAGPRTPDPAGPAPPDSSP